MRLCAGWELIKMKIKTLLYGAMFAGLSVYKAIGADNPPPPATQATSSTQPASTQPIVTLITMHLKASPKDSFDELAKQSGVKFTADNNLWEQDNMQDDLQIDLDKKPFWSALDELSEVCNVRAQSVVNFNSGGFGNNNNNARRLVLFPAGPHPDKAKPPTFESDGFMVQALSFNRQQSVNYTSPQMSQGSCSVQIMVYVDPAIHVSSFSQNIRPTSAVDDKGQSMLLESNGNTIAYGGNRASSLIYPAAIALKYPENAGKKIADLKFTLQLRGSTQVDSINVDKPLDSAEVTKDFGDTTVIFHSLKKLPRPGNYEMKVGFMSDSDEGTNNLYSMLQSAQLLDSKGHAFYAMPGGGTSGNGTAEYTMTYSTNMNGMRMGGENAASGPPVKWVLELPTKSHAIKLPVEFKDLPLP
jgi:hypothetical protein